MTTNKYSLRTYSCKLGCLARFAIKLAALVGTALDLGASGPEVPPSSVTPSPPSPTTYCNPISLPNYPIGRTARAFAKAEQFRELADPSALWHEGKWYLYPSCDMAWVSADEGLTWQHHPLNVRDIGYAPSVVRHGGRFWLTAFNLDLFSSDSPLGPFERAGKIKLPKVPEMPALGDPMLFSDDGRLYLYWGCTPRLGIWMVELDAKDPTSTISVPACAIPFRPDLHPWEAVGNWNQNAAIGYLEGPWMLKVGKRYYLTYSAAGTEFRTYAMGCYVADHPLGPFTPQKRNPILRTVEGLITGTGHGSIVVGPRDRLWAFYCVRAAVAHKFERRIGFDLAAIDANGELYVPQVTTTPQILPAIGGQPEQSSSSGWLPLTDGEPTAVSSDVANLRGLFATDDNLMTWWQPAESDATPFLEAHFNAPATVHAVRIIWRDVGLNTRTNANPGPIRYRVDLLIDRETWVTVIDRSASNDDLMIDYRECAPMNARKARLVILGAPKGITPGVAEFTVFGKTIRGPVSKAE